MSSLALTHELSKPLPPFRRAALRQEILRIAHD
jgi:hypothetical protein